MKSLSLFLLILFVSLRFELVGQTSSPHKTNLTICFELIDSILTKTISEIDKSEGKTFSAKLVSDYSLFSNFVIDRISKLNLKQSEGLNPSDINFTVSNIKVKYGIPSKEGFFGDYSVERNIKIEGSFLYPGTTSNFINIEETYSDVIHYDSIKEVENISLPFTKGEVPDVPLFSSILEPSIVVGSAALMIYLFFSVRGK